MYKKRIKLARDKKIKEIKKLKRDKQLKKR